MYYITIQTNTLHSEKVIEIDKIMDHQSDKSTENTDILSVSPSFQNTCINGTDRSSVSPDDQNTCTSSNTTHHDQQSFNINTLKIENFEECKKIGEFGKRNANSFTGFIQRIN